MRWDTIFNFKGSSGGTGHEKQVVPSNNWLSIIVTPFFIPVFSSENKKSFWKKSQSQILQESNICPLQLVHKNQDSLMIFIA